MKMTFDFLPHPLPFMYKYVFLKQFTLGSVGFFMVMTVTTLHYVFIFASDHCGSSKFVLFFYNILSFFTMLLHVVAFLLSFFMIAGIVWEVPAFVTVFMVAYVWWVMLLLLGNTIHVWACLCGQAKFGGLLLHGVFGYVLPIAYLLGALYMNMYAEMMDA